MNVPLITPIFKLDPFKFVANSSRITWTSRLNSVKDLSGVNNCIDYIEGDANTLQLLSIVHTWSLQGFV
jgi:hypothetical protein